MPSTQLEPPTRRYPSRSTRTWTVSPFFQTSTATAATAKEDHYEQPPKKRTREMTTSSKAIITGSTKATVVSPSPSPPSGSSKALSTGIETPRSSKTKKPTSARKSPPPPAPGSRKPPKDWLEIDTLVRELRCDRSAPVDEAGAEVLPEQHLGDKSFRLQVLISLMLSSQTKDAVVGEAIRNLQKKGLTVENLSKMSAEELNQCINKVGFHNNKTKYIKQAVEILVRDYDGDIPKEASAMIENLPGVGPKMAYIAENIAWGTTSGIGVDTHMHRMFNQLGWVRKTSTPEKTRVELEAWLPREYWKDVNYLWVGLGQEVTQQKPKILSKALDCSRPLEALKLLQRLGMDLHKEADKAGCGEQVRAVLQKSKS